MTQNRLGRTARATLAALLLPVFLATACGGDDGVAGTYEHDEEGTIVLAEDGTGTITQSGDPTEFSYEVDGDTVKISIDGEVRAEATIDGDDLRFRPGDFSGDDPVTFEKQKQ